MFPRGATRLRGILWDPERGAYTARAATRPASCSSSKGYGPPWESGGSFGAASWTRRRQAGDRGTQHFDEELPHDLPAAIVLHTKPTKKDDNRWDWSYVSALHFEVEAAK